MLAPLDLGISCIDARYVVGPRLCCIQKASMTLVPTVLSLRVAKRPTQLREWSQSGRLLSASSTATTHWAINYISRSRTLSLCVWAGPLPALAAKSVMDAGLSYFQRE